MSEDKTANQDERSFEERVFARFDAMDGRFNNIDVRLERLEAKQYDTKPMWERTLTEIAELRTEAGERFDSIERKLGLLYSDIINLRADQLRDERRVDKLEAERVKS